MVIQSGCSFPCVFLFYSTETNCKSQEKYYISLGERGRNRPLSVNEALLAYRFLEVDPRDFASDKGA
jgi:hypothetical protein